MFLRNLWATLLGIVYPNKAVYLEKLPAIAWKYGCDWPITAGAMPARQSLETYVFLQPGHPSIQGLGTQYSIAWNYGGTSTNQHTGETLVEIHSIPQTPQEKTMEFPKAEIVPLNWIHPIKTLGPEEVGYVNFEPATILNHDACVSVLVLPSYLSLLS